MDNYEKLLSVKRRLGKMLQLRKAQIEKLQNRLKHAKAVLNEIQLDGLYDKSSG